MKQSISTIFEKLDLLGFDDLRSAKTAFVCKPWEYDLEPLDTTEIVALDDWLRNPDFTN